jgi:hypothetical protein
MKTIIVLTAVLLLTGCTGGILMRHPDGREAECGHRWIDIDASSESRCVQDFTSQGFVRRPR